MDLMFDDNTTKLFKKFGVAAVGLAAIATIIYSYNRYVGNDNQSQAEQEAKGKSKIKPAGIYNQGNTCFVNSLLQALAPLKLFIKNLQQITAQSQGNGNNEQNLLFQLKQSLKKINTEKQSVDVTKFLGSINQVSQIINLQQQDAYELFSIIVSSLEHVYNQSKNMSLCRSSLSLDHSEQFSEDLMNCDRENNKQVNNILLGYTKSSIICSSCKQETNIKIHPFYNLSFDISPKMIRTLEQAINHFQQKQYIQDWACTKCSITSHLKRLQNTKSKLMKDISKDNQFLVSICKQIREFLQKNNDELQISEVNQKLGSFVKKYQKQYLLLPQNSQKDKVFLQITPKLTKITKQCVISKFPKILAIHLKQLSINPITGQPMLLRKHIQFPKNLQISVRNGAKCYELVSLVSHTGNESEGHYFTFRKLNSESEKWYFISDTTSKECKQSFIKMSMPYMLFYQLKQ